MSAKYDEYLTEHKTNVGRAFDWLVLHCPELFEDEQFKANVEYNCKFQHDKSKNATDEYEPYDNYFYGNRSYEVVQEFKKAWLKHIHRNQHHWQHWVLINDEPDEGIVTLEIPDEYIIEMICDWWSFSWKSGDLSEIFNWYDDHKDNMKINPESKAKIEYILSLIKQHVDDEYE